MAHHHLATLLSVGAIVGVGAIIWAFVAFAELRGVVRHHRVRAASATKGRLYWHGRARLAESRLLAVEEAIDKEEE
jgi:hypothetical protein